MLYVYYMNHASMLVFDEQPALVKQLQDAIKAETGLEVHDQIVLVTGGEVLEPDKKLTNYSAGQLLLFFGCSSRLRDQSGFFCHVCNMPGPHCGCARFLCWRLDICLRLLPTVCHLLSFLFFNVS